MTSADGGGVRSSGDAEGGYEAWTLCGEETRTTQKYRASGRYGVNWPEMAERKVVFYAYNAHGGYIGTYETREYDYSGDHSWGDQPGYESGLEPAYVRMQVGLVHCGAVIHWSEASDYLRLSDGEMLDSLPQTPVTFERNAGERRFAGWQTELSAGHWSVVAEVSGNMHRSGRNKGIFRAGFSPKGEKLTPKFVHVREADYTQTTPIRIRMDDPYLQAKAHTDAQMSFTFTPVNEVNIPAASSCQVVPPPTAELGSGKPVVNWKLVPNTIGYVIHPIFYREDGTVIDPNPFDRGKADYNGDFQNGPLSYRLMNPVSAKYALQQGSVYTRMQLGLMHCGEVVRWAQPTLYLNMLPDTGGWQGESIPMP